MTSLASLSSLGHKALFYAETLQWAVFPLKPRDKTPLSRNGFKDATTDPKQIRAWWLAYPDANIGAPTGSQNGFWVLDKDGQQGQFALSALVDEYGPLPETAFQQTGQGEHYLFAWEAGIKNSASKLGPGLDVRGEGGYIVLAPSVHPSGASYAWESSSEPPDTPLAPGAWLVPLVKASALSPRPLSGERAEDDLSIPQGRRNDSLAKLAGAWRRASLSADEIAAALLKANQKRCKPPLPAEEVQAIARSISRYPAGQASVALPAETAKIAHHRRLLENHGYTLDGAAFAVRKPIIEKGEEVDYQTIPLASFRAWITSEIEKDDGLHCEKSYVIEGQKDNGEALPPIEVPAGDFEAMKWPGEMWGRKASIFANYRAVNNTRRAIDILSEDAPQTRVFGHTGWRQVDGRWVYLHAGRQHPEVVDDPVLKRYALPQCPQERCAQRDALRASLSLLTLFPDELAYPLLAATYLAPLAQWCTPDFSIYLDGPTGTFKSSLSAVFLSHFGSFSFDSLPVSWMSTTFSLEAVTSALKDTLIVIDDNVPGNGRHEDAENAKKADYVLRAVGNRTARGRLSSNRSQEQAYVPKGLLLTSGEDLPQRASIMARLLVVPTSKGGRALVEKQALGRAQEIAAHLAEAMAVYIDWLQPQLETLPDRLTQQFERNRARFSDAAAHPRTAGQLARLTTGLEAFLTCAQEKGALSPEEKAALYQRFFDAFESLAQYQAQEQGERTPARIFLSEVRALLASGRARLERLDGFSSVESDPRPVLGWEEDDVVYLHPGSALQAVGQFCQQSGRPFQFSAQALGKSLMQNKCLLANESGAGGRVHPTKVKQIPALGKKLMRCFWIRASLIKEEGDDTHSSDS